MSKCKECFQGTLIPRSQQRINLLCLDGRRHGIDMTCARSECSLRGGQLSVQRRCIDVTDIKNGERELIPVDWKEPCLHPELIGI